MHVRIDQAGQQNERARVNPPCMARRLTGISVCLFYRDNPTTINQYVDP
jgi:hypothetical protein